MFCFPDFLFKWAKAQTAALKEMLHICEHECSKINEENVPWNVLRTKGRNVGELFLRCTSKEINISFPLDFYGKIVIWGGSGVPWTPPGRIPAPGVDS